MNSQGMRFVPVPGTNILMCTTETTVAQFRAAGISYKAPRYPQALDHAASNISWNEARAWCRWLSKKEGVQYRLPTCAEWKAAAGPDKFPWGAAWPPPSNCDNLSGQELRGCTPQEKIWLSLDLTVGTFKFLEVTFDQMQSMGLVHNKVIGGFSDVHKFTAPVAFYPANRLGIHHLGGNVSELCEDIFPSWPKMGSYLGGSYLTYTQVELVPQGSGKWPAIPKQHMESVGFRCVLVR